MRLTGKQISSKSNKQKDSIADYGNIDFHCSNCGKLIAKLKLLNPDKKVESHIKAKCPYCGNKSFLKTIIGRFAFIEVDGLKIKEFPMTSEKLGNGNIIQNVIVISEKL